MENETGTMPIKLASHAKGCNVSMPINIVDVAFVRFSKHLKSQITSNKIKRKKIETGYGIFSVLIPVLEFHDTASRYNHVHILGLLMRPILIEFLVYYDTEISKCL